MNIRRKAYKKRALASLHWYIGPDFKFAVKLYALVQKATASKSVPIDLRTNEVLKASSTMIDDDTGLPCPCIHFIYALHPEQAAVLLVTISTRK